MAHGPYSYSRIADAEKTVPTTKQKIIEDGEVSDDKKDLEMPLLTLDNESDDDAKDKE